MIGTTILLFSLSSTAWAFPDDMPVSGDGRGNAMVGAGSAVASGGPAIASNPAGLANVKNVSASLAGDLLMISLKAPANGPMTKSSSFSLAPLFYLGGGIRLHELIVVGLNAFLPAGSGAAYPDVNLSGYDLSVPNPPKKDWAGSLMIMEFGPAIAFNLPYHLKLGAAYRINYFAQSFSGYSPTPISIPNLPTSLLVPVEQDMSLSGWGYTGFRVGIQWDPIEVFHIGIAYRSSVKADLKGANKTIARMGTAMGGNIQGELDVKTTTTYADKLSIGLGYDVIPKKLTLVFDYELDLFQRNAKEYTLTVTDEAGNDTKQVVKENARNRHNFRLGGEYWVIDPLAIRAGIAFMTNPKPVEYHNPNTGGAPASSVVAGLGGGYKVIDNLRIDLAYTLVYSEGEVSKDNPDLTPYALPGKYLGMINQITLGIEFTN